jgi:peptidoglycan-associated lipoprotein
MKIRKSLVLIALCSVFTACGGSNVQVPPAQAPAASGDNSKADSDPTRGNISVSDDIKKACGLSDDEAYFAFDSAHLNDQDKRVIHKLADCFVTGAMKDRKMSLVGHADPRGTADYNMALAGKRADAVKQLIVTESMPDGRVATTSRGAMDAKGTDEASWAKDRRVDVTAGN